MARELGLFAVVFFLSAAAPGPDTMLMFGRAVSGGWRLALPYAVGITAGKVALLGAAAAGVAAAAAALGPFFVVLKVAGALYLVWLGVGLWRRGGADLDRAPSAQPSSLAAGAGAGFVLAISNPQAILFYVALLPAVIGIDRLDLVRFAGLALTLVAVMAAVSAAYLVAAARARAALSNPSRRRAADRVLGILLIGTGAVVAAR